VAPETFACDDDHFLVSIRGENIMPTFELVLPPQVYSSWRPARRTSRRLVGAFSLLTRWTERARQRDALAGLDDGQLRDIGITRADAARECEKPFWR
jgi:uncharacterized protein YjiS (DUF1127 family)